MSYDVCVQGSTCTDKVLIHHRQHAQVTVYMASTLCEKIYWCDRETERQQNKDKGGFPGDSPLCPLTLVV